MTSALKEELKKWLNRLAADEMKEQGGPPGAESRARSACGSKNRLWQGGALIFTT